MLIVTSAIETEFRPQNITNTFNVNNAINAKLLLHYRLRAAIFFWKFQILTTFSFVNFQQKNSLFTLKDANYFKGTEISVSFFACGNDILIISRYVFRYLVSYLTGKYSFRNWQKQNRKVLKSKISFKRLAIFANEYLQNNKYLTCKLFKCYFVFTIHGNTETLKTRKGSFFSNLSECMTVTVIFILPLLVVKKYLRLN